MTKSITLYYQSGECSSTSIRQWLENANLAVTPDWSWYEPRPGSVFTEKATDLANALHPILRPGMPVIPSNQNTATELNEQIKTDLELEELRLFWPLSSLHLVCDEKGGHRWFQWSVTESDNHWPNQIDTIETINTIETRQPVLLRNKSLNAFFLQHSATNHSNDLELVEYRKGNSLIAWTLTSNDDKGSLA